MYIIKGRNPAQSGENIFILHDLRSDELILSVPVSEAELNASGSFTFTISPEHPHYNDMIKMVTFIDVYQDGDWLYTFRVIDENIDLWKNKEIICEGDLGLLNDSNQRQGEYHDLSVADFFGMIIQKHNADVDERKRFQVGAVNVTDSNDSLYRYANFEASWPYIKDKLLDRLGGYVRTRYEGGIRYIDYLTSYGKLNKQPIILGENIIDMIRSRVGRDIATVVIPLGAKLTDADGNETEQRLTVEDANVLGSRYGLDYIENPAMISVYGRIVKCVTFEDVTTPDYLYNKGAEWLAQQTEIDTLELTAADLHLTDKQIEAFRLGDLVRVVSKPHGIDKTMKISKLSTDYTAPENTKIYLGATQETFAETINRQANETAQQIQEQGEEIREFRRESSEFQREITADIDRLSSRISERTNIQTLLEEIQMDFTSTITQTAREITMEFVSQIIDVENGIIENSGLIREYIRFKGALIELGKVGSAFTTKLSNEELAFYEYGKKIAYISGTKLNIVQANITKLLTLGNESIGEFDFIVKSNGNLAFKWRDEA